MKKLAKLVVLLGVIFVLLALAGCSTVGGQRVVVLSPDGQVLATRQVILSNPSSPEGERVAQEWARLTAERERQQMEYNLRRQQQNAYNAQEWARIANQNKANEAFRRQMRQQQNLEAARELRYSLTNLIGAIKRK